MTTTVTVLGIDLGKNWFHLVGLDERGAIALRKKLNRLQLMECAATMSRCLVAMESCPGSQYWGRVFARAGHDLRLIPPQFVKPYLKSNKNDFNDAEAIAEAASRARMRCVPLKTPEQLELQALHRVRRRFVTERTALVNQMRALLLEHGIVIPLGRALFARRLPAIFEDAENGLSPSLVHLLHRLRQRWIALDLDIDEITGELTRRADASDLCRRAASVPGIGPIIATAMVAAVGDGRMFRQGRGMAAWLGLVPRQYSTGGQVRLGGISKRGNTYLRQLVIQGAHALAVHLKRQRSSLGDWFREVERRSHHNVAVVALANKLVRFCWKMLTSGEAFQLPLVRVA